MGTLSMAAAYMAPPAFREGIGDYPADAPDIPRGS